jgi:hypothetical protein
MTKKAQGQSCWFRWPDSNFFHRHLFLAFTNSKFGEGGLRTMLHYCAQGNSGEFFVCMIVRQENPYHTSLSRSSRSRTLPYRVTTYRRHSTKTHTYSCKPLVGIARLRKLARVGSWVRDRAGENLSSYASLGVTLHVWKFVTQHP